MTAHALDPLSADEIRTVVEVLRARDDVTDATRFAYIGLHEPDKQALLSGAAVDREARVVVVPGPESTVIEAVVAVTAREVRSWTAVDARPALLFEESYNAINAVRAHPEFHAAMKRRGITELDLVQIDPWPAGSYAHPYEEGRRIARCACYLRADPKDNGYARPIEGVLVVVDMGRGEVLEVLDHGLVPLPPERASYYPEDVGPPREGLRPLEISQPDGPSFTLDGHELTWQRWSLRIGFDPYEGLILHTVGYQDGDRLRPVLHRASICEMVVPYGDPSPMHAWKNAFDVGEWGLGRLANSLALGCDCLGEITYLDATFATEQGDPYPLANAICIHEEDYGILWKHVDMHSGTTEVRRSRRLVISSISTVGNYEYGFYWYLYLDGTIQLEVKLTGILQTRALAPDEPHPYAPLIAPQLAAPVHQHLFCARLDLDVDGPGNEVWEVDAERVPVHETDNPLGNAFRAARTRLDSEQAAQRVVDASTSRTWHVTNPAATNRLGEPVAYKLVAGPVPTLFADAASSVHARAGFATRNLWVTPYTRDERRAAGDHPNQHPGGDGLPRWTAADRSLVDTDVVLWHTFGVTHIPRPEDWPVMPVEYCGFHLVPVGFFDRNPALDLPPASTDHCH